MYNGGPQQPPKPSLIMFASISTDSASLAAILQTLLAGSLRGMCIVQKQCKTAKKKKKNTKMNEEEKEIKTQRESQKEGEEKKRRGKK